MNKSSGRIEYQPLLDMPGQRWRKPVAIATLSLALVAAIAFGLAATGVEAEISDLTTSKVTSGPLNLSVRGHGSLAPSNLVAISSATGGRVERLHVSRGEQVEKGDPLVTLANPELMAELRNLEVDYAARLAQVELAQLNFRSKRAELRSSLKSAEDEQALAEAEMHATSELADKRIVSKFEGERAKIRHSAAVRKTNDIRLQLSEWEKSEKSLNSANDAEIAALRVRLDETRRNVELLVLRAPISGVVYELSDDINSGTYLQPTTTVAKLSSGEILNALVRVPSTDSRLVAVGMKGDVMTSSARLNAEVIRVDPQAIRDEVMVTLALNGRENDKEIRAGMPVAAEIHYATFGEVLHMANSTFLGGPGDVDVYVLSEDMSVALRKSIVLGEADDANVIIKSGLAEGDVAIISDTSTFAGEEEVSIVQ